jgi:signal transduction histidine kinase
MLRNLRWQLSILYVLAAAALVSLIGAGTYGLLSYYFQSSTDLALQYKVALEFTRVGQPIPADLQAVDQAWQTSRTSPLPTQPPQKSEDDEEKENHEGNEHAKHPFGEEYEEYYDSELASIFLLLVNAQGQILSNPNTYNLSFDPDSQAIQAALSSGSDFRTVRQSDGSRVRLFTYRVPVDDSLAVLQVGRSVRDQDRVLGQLLLGLVGLGGLGVLVVGLGSWWLAGRSLIPAQRAWDRQQTFIANASHELRAPLTLLRASAEVARRGIDDQDSRHELLGDILTETDHMNRLVDDLLLLSRLDAGRLQLDRQPVNLAELLDDLAREMGRVAAEGGVTIEVIHVQGVALADPIRLRQVLLIVLDNALRHTPKSGTIHLEARAHERMIQIQVNDTGSGIPAQHLPHIFDRFYRGEGDRSQPSHGSGLGLAIAKGLVEAMQGDITINSQSERGTQVTIQLPAKEN